MKTYLKTDKNAKKNVKNAGKNIQKFRFLDALQGLSIEIYSKNVIV